MAASGPYLTLSAGPETTRNPSSQDGPNPTPEGSRCGVGSVGAHLVSAPVPGGHDGQTKGHPSPWEISCGRVPEHMHGVCSRQVAGGVGDGPGGDGLGVCRLQLLITANLVESWRIGQSGLVLGGPDSQDPPIISCSNWNPYLTFSAPGRVEV